MNEIGLLFINTVAWPISLANLLKLFMTAPGPSLPVALSCSPTAIVSKDKRQHN